VVWEVEGESSNPISDNYDFSLDNEPQIGYYLLVLHQCVILQHPKTMPISFLPYQKEYQEQIKILASLLKGTIHRTEGTSPRASWPFPKLTGTFRQRDVEIKIIQEATGAGSDPLHTEKFLLICMRCASTLQMKIGPKSWLVRLHSLIWWHRIFTGNKSLDDIYAITSQQRTRSMRLFSHKKIHKFLLQLGPFHTLQLAQQRLDVRYLITSHQVFMARNVAERLQQLAQFARLTENLA